MTPEIFNVIFDLRFNFYEKYKKYPKYLYAGDLEVRDIGRDKDFHRYVEIRESSYFVAGMELIEVNKEKFLEVGE